MRHGYKYGSLAMGTLFPELDLADRPPSRGQRITSLSLSLADRDDFSRREPLVEKPSNFIPKKIFQISSRTVPDRSKEKEEEEVSAVGDKTTPPAKG